MPKNTSKNDSTIPVYPTIKPLSKLILSANGTVAIIISDETTPEISPNVIIVFFICVSSSAKGECASTIPEQPGSLSSSFRVIFAAGSKKSYVRATNSRQQTEFLPKLHRLRSPPGPQFVENPTGMCLDRVLAYKKFFSDLAIAHSLRYQLQDLQLSPRNPQVLSLSLVRDKWLPARDRHLLRHNPILPSGQLKPQPNTQHRKCRRDQPTINLNRVFNYQEPVLRPLQQGYQQPAD